MLRDFDLKQLTGMKNDELAQTGISDPNQVKSALIQDPLGLVKKDDKKDADKDKDRERRCRQSSKPSTLQQWMRSSERSNEVERSCRE